MSNEVFLLLRQTPYSMMSLDQEVPRNKHEPLETYATDFSWNTKEKRREQ